MIHALPPELVREAERLAVAAAPEDALMLRAARGVADAVEHLGGGEATVVALVGGGDNGGDALHAAAMLARDGSEVRAALLSAHPHSRALAEARSAGVDIRELSLPLDEGVPTWLQGDIWIDGLTGTGLTGPLREPLAGAVGALGRAARRWGTRIVAVDVPSGSCAVDGTLPGAVLRADHTVTMGAFKTPLLLPPAAQYAGTLEVVDLGTDVGGARRAHGAEGEGSALVEVLRPEDVDVA
ncbi:NAD(P)H-hydrate epimerase, partial [Actinomyces sp.]|uniref:NAD(P)H-hydrate epimerase n=1 Tax=Actinomyces sp. TaxID=29317 RepID=UPI0028A17A9E